MADSDQAFGFKELGRASLQVGLKVFALMFAPSGDGAGALVGRLCLLLDELRVRWGAFVEIVPASGLAVGLVALAVELRDSLGTVGLKPG